MFVKVCGIRSIEDALFCADCGVGAIGFVFYPKSPRFVDVRTAEEIAEKVADKLLLVAVSKRVEEIPRAALDFCQLVQIYHHSDSVKDRLILGVSGPCKAHAKYYLIDSSHGRGLFTEYPEDLYGLPRDRVILSGGLTPDNVSCVIEKYKPFGVDVSSGVEEAPGVKSKELIKLFVERAKGEEL